MNHENFSPRRIEDREGQFFVFFAPFVVERDLMVEIGAK
jgi:hypothetical protein